MASIDLFFTLVIFKEIFLICFFSANSRFLLPIILLFLILKTIQFHWTLWLHFSRNNEDVVHVVSGFFCTDIFGLYWLRRSKYTAVICWGLSNATPSTLKVFQMVLFLWRVGTGKKIVLMIVSTNRKVLWNTPSLPHAGL